jgi:hypothetical protein
VIPDYEADGNLPIGVHSASWSEFVARYGFNSYRKTLLEGLERALRLLKQVGCSEVYLDGSYVTSKGFPNYYDGAWSLTGVNLVLLKRLEPIFFEFGSGRVAQKAKFLGELFPVETQEGRSGRSFLNFFQTDRDTGQAKGIVHVELRTLNDQE